MAEIFREGEKVRWKNAHFMEPKNNMTIIKIGEMGRVKKALCEYIVNNERIQNGLSVAMSEPLKDWFPLSELEHVSEIP